MRIVEYVVAGISVMMLSGCVSAEQQTDYSICYGLATKPSYNINREAREAEVRRRGINCRVYDSRIDAEVLAEKMAEASAPRVYNANITEENKQERTVTISRPVANEITDYRDLVCKNGRIMTSYGCRYR